MLQHATLLGLVCIGFVDRPWEMIIPGAVMLMLLSVLGGQWQLGRNFQLLGAGLFLARLPGAVVMSAVQWLLFAGAAFTIGKMTGWVFWAIVRAVGFS